MANPEQSEIPQHAESPLSVAIDGARLSVYTASMMAQIFEEAQTAEMLMCIEQAGQWLNRARALLPVTTTSIHVAPALGSIIIPG